MRKFSIFAAAAVALSLFAGCASLDVQSSKQNGLNGEQLSTSGDAVAHIEATNWGLYLFMIPLLTGSTEKPGELDIQVVKDTVNAESVTKMLTKKSKELGGKKVLNMTSYHNANGWMFYIREYQMSANVVK